MENNISENNLLEPVQVGKFRFKDGLAETSVGGQLKTLTLRHFVQLKSFGVWVSIIQNYDNPEEKELDICKAEAEFMIAESPDQIFDNDSACNMLIGIPSYPHNFDKDLVFSSMEEDFDKIKRILIKDQSLDNLVDAFNVQ